MICEKLTMVKGIAADNPFFIPIIVFSYLRDIEIRKWLRPLS